MILDKCIIKNKRKIYNLKVILMWRTSSLELKNLIEIFSRMSNYQVIKNELFENKNRIV